MPTIAVLLLVIDGLPLEAHWRHWAGARAGVPPEWRVVFHTHAKHPGRTAGWVADTLIGASFAPEWGSVELVRAALALVATALANPDVQHLVLASESCVPVAPLATWVRELEADPRPWLAYDLPRSRFDHERADAARVPPGTPCKADQWWVLTRAAAAAAAADPHAWRDFQAVTASDEWYFPTVLAMAGWIDLGPLHAEEAARKRAAQRRELYGLPAKDVAPGVAAPGPGASPPDHRVARRRATYCVWASPSVPSPEWLVFTPEVVAAARAQGSLLARKFRAADVPLEAWVSAVYVGATQ
jgi:hypothetical protein